MDFLKKKGKKWKIPPKKVPSDSCTVTVDGEQYPLHEGESVWVIPVQSMRHYASLMRIRNLVADTSDSASIGDLCAEIAERIVDWDWTSLDGAKLPKPYQNGRLLESLTSEEVAWLIDVIQGESKEERKNASAPSEEKS